MGAGEGTTAAFQVAEERGLEPTAPPVQLSPGGVTHGCTGCAAEATQPRYAARSGLSRGSLLPGKGLFLTPHERQELQDGKYKPLCCSQGPGRSAE